MTSLGRLECGRAIIEGSIDFETISPGLPLSLRMSLRLLDIQHPQDVMGLMRTLEESYRRKPLERRLYRVIFEEVREI